MKKSRKSRKNYSKKKYSKKYHFGRDIVKCNHDGNDACCSFIFGGYNPLDNREDVWVSNNCEQHCKWIGDNPHLFRNKKINYWHCPERPQWVIDKIKSEELRNSRTQAYETV